MKQQKKPLKIKTIRKVKTSKRTELWYSQALRQFVQGVVNEVDEAVTKTATGSLVYDSANGLFYQALSVAIKRLIERKIDNIAQHIVRGFVRRANAQNQQETCTRIKQATGVDLSEFLKNTPKVAEKVEMATLANIQLIRSIHSQYLDKVQNIITQSALSGKLLKEIKSEIKEAGKITEKRALFIARDQMAKFNSALTQARHEEIGIKKYKWSTSGDERVRESHMANDGKVFSYDDPPETGHPGEDYNCRCVALPVFEYELTSTAT